MKKKLIVGMSMVLALTLGLTSCGGKGEKKPSSSGEAKGINAEISVQAEKEWMDYYNGAIERVKKDNPDATINIIEKGAFDHIDVIDQTDGTNKDVADVFAIPIDRISGLVKNDVLGAVDTEYIKSKVSGYEDLDNGIGKNFKVDGDYLGFPYNIETLVVYANKANAEAKGVDYSKALEFNDLKQNDFVTKIHDLWFGVAFLNSADINLLTKEDDGKLTTDLTTPYNELSEDKQAVFEALYNYWKGNSEENSPILDKSSADSFIDESFKSGGESSLRLDGPWAMNSLGEFTNEGKDLDVVSTEMITVNGKPLKHWKSGWGLVINSRIEVDEDKMALANALIAELINPEYAEDLFKATGKILENVSVEDYEKTGLSDADKNVIKATIDSYEKSVARPTFSEIDNVWTTWENAILSWNSVKPADAEAAYNEVKASFEAFMTNIGQ
ncbi:sugar ABC transporter substrate-binding protein [Miniphocaeibacter halophilus]|uniref:Uncharacterized protein n=1 Tax=Miniphocaeibacter halophilus TaxID=2931922 RepID=A0AC61MNT8_9FIRM|nr:sugar ABC transporter substrate-binding protein [Miniphocaeibacter halophilus]QQK07175.1 hypothetical protein JFY71_07535 [Miniphocaeibacter halophilus]